MLLFRQLSLISLLIMLSACAPVVDQFEMQQQRFLQDVRYIAQQPRIPGQAHHKRVEEFCAERFRQLGLEVSIQDYGTGRNIIGLRRGQQKADEYIMLSAHYDTVKQCKGADDNASGIAGVFETARILLKQDYQRSLLLACWDQEEENKLGSKAFVRKQKQLGRDIKMSYVYEMIAYQDQQGQSQQFPVMLAQVYSQQLQQIAAEENRADFIALVYDHQADKMLNTLDANARSQGLKVFHFKVDDVLKKSPFAKDLTRSDHASFWDADYPAMMITDTANFRNPHYHCEQGEDTVETLNSEFAIKTINTFAQTIADNLISIKTASP